jgi:leucyl aminopeptidase
MKIKLENQQKINLKKGKTLFFPFFSGEKIKVKNREVKKEIDKFSAASQSFQESEVRLVSFKKGETAFLNLGEREKWSQRKFLLAVRKIIRFMKENRIRQGALFLEEIIPRGIDLNNLVVQISENILLADYEFTRYKEKPKEGWSRIELVEIGWPDSSKYQKDLNQGEIIGQAVNFVRDLANIPGGEMTPQKLANSAIAATKKFKNIKTEVFDEKRIKKLGMGGILGVAQGSSQKPRLIVLKYFGKAGGKKFDLAFIGKGVTFDTGGLDIKPFESMKEGMQMDMSGGAAVLGAILAIAKIKVPLNIVGVIPAVENMLSGQALRPGDILTAYNGKTIEVISTDAEGRVILADALSYVVKNFQPKMIIDVATLTSAAVVALGQRAIGLFTNLPEMESIFRQIGEDSGDYVWPLPLWEEYEEEIKGTFGDIANLGKTKYGGAITAALFLKNFTERTSWIHLDIAPTMTSIENQGLAKGAAGSGVCYLVKLAQDFQKIKKNL